MIKILTSPSNKSAKGLLIMVTAKSSKKTYKVPLTLNSKGIATFKASTLNAGYYKICIHQAVFVPGPDSGCGLYMITPGALKTSSLKVNKANTTVSAPQVKNKFKKSRYFKITVKHKLTKKVVKGLKLKLKVSTGKKYKTYYVKTNSKGIANFNTKNLKRGKHKVLIYSANGNFIVSKKSYIVIK